MGLKASGVNRYSVVVGSPLGLRRTSAFRMPLVTNPRSEART